LCEGWKHFGFGEEKCIVEAKAQPSNFIGSTNHATQTKDKDITSLGDLQCSSRYRICACLLKTTHETCMTYHKLETLGFA